MSITVRNISVTPLELLKVEHFEGEAAPIADQGIAALLVDLLRLPYNLITGNKDANGTGLVAKSGSQPSATDAVEGVRIGPFETHRTEIKTPDAGHEVLRLTFKAEFDGGAAHRIFTADIPAASARSIELKPVEGGSDGPESDAAKNAAFTVVYTPGSSHLAILSSASLAKWMSTIDGSWPVSSLSLPGTHNSPAYHYALPSVRCQAVDVRTQLDNGVRFLDVRVSVSPPAQPHTDPRIGLVHSVFPVGLFGLHYFQELYVAVCGFLDANPSETVLISIKKEGTGKGNDADLANQLINHYTGKADDGAQRPQGALPPYDGKAESWRWYTEPKIPTLNEARGRIVLVRRFGLPDEENFKSLNGGRGWGVDGSSWPDNCEDGTCGTGLLRLQDYYDVAQTTAIATKINYVHGLLAKSACENYCKVNGDVNANASGPTPPMYINFLTGSNFFNARCWPENVAARVNPSVVEYLCVRHGEAGEGQQAAVGAGSTGVVVTDWVGYRGDWDLIRCVVAWNARLQLRQ
ncbi:phosphatidylinositol-specific phospholipase c [Ophiostoma piceae UAMH 11346]|uniref:Phosphatidylinositol-specific phospholipase c n=1 Tax=Ophiostoma piceae (strain UAMH 11346) TaxID=1262450 RepID=S3C7V2_OPHP1|nr:phosphatidylinositol-specific phospholipase c [Ophiostoma piceae UAMH 11346]